MRRRCGDELEADALPHAGEHGSRADGELVAAVQLRGDLVPALRGPVALAVERAGELCQRNRGGCSVSATALSRWVHQNDCATRPCVRSKRASMSWYAAAASPAPPFRSSCHHA